MSADLLSLASKYLEPELLNRIASAVGADRTLVGKASSAAIPALFDAFAGMASSSDGARKLANAVSEHSPGIVGMLASSLSGSGRQGLIDQGARGLASLLGRNSFSVLASAVGKFAGLTPSSSFSLMGILGPFVLGIIGNQASEHGLDSGDLARLLRSQRDKFQAAMPSGFKDVLQSVGSPTGTDGPWRTESMSASSIPSASHVVSQPSTGRWLLMLFPALALGALAWGLFNGRLNDQPNHPTQTAAPSPDKNQTTTTYTQTADIRPTDNAPTGSLDPASTINTALGTIKSALEKVTDETSARSAVPQLEIATSELEKIVQLSGRLPNAEKNALAALVTSARPTLENSFNRVLAIPGVDSIAKPAIETLRNKLASLSAA